MKKCICGSTSFEKTDTQDIGFDHNIYEDKITSKTYYLCNECGTIFRADKNLRDPFSKEYFNSDNTRLCSRRNNRNREITKLVDMIYDSSSTFTVCDFGASDGSLLLEIKKEFPKALIVGVDIELEKLARNGIEAFHTMEAAFNRHKIDLLISSNSLLYTDYQEFISILHNRKPANVILTGPNHISRPAQLFYDDVITNASPFGTVQMMLNNEYSVNNQLAISSSNESEFVALCQYHGSHVDKLKNPLSRMQFDLIKKKAEILHSYKHQYKTESSDDLLAVFGTSIDSALFSSFHSGTVIFLKDNAMDGELFRGECVREASEYKRRIIVPKLMNNAERIRHRVNKD